MTGCFLSERGLEIQYFEVSWPSVDLLKASAPPPEPKQMQVDRFSLSAQERSRRGALTFPLMKPYLLLVPL